MSEVARGWRWGRVVAEGLLIVLSILLAFGIEAWWGRLGYVGGYLGTIRAAEQRGGA